jgi:hypothetical protein
VSFLIWTLAVSGATLILTHGSIFAWLREALPEGKLRTLVHCPMCTGFWMGVVASLSWISPASTTSTMTEGGYLHTLLVARNTFADGCAGAVLSAAMVSVWILLGKAGNAAGEIEVLAIELKHLVNLRRYHESLPKPEEKAPPNANP